MPARSASASAGSSPFEHVRRATEELRAAVRGYELAILEWSRVHGADEDADLSQREIARLSASA